MRERINIFCFATTIILLVCCNETVQKGTDLSKENVGSKVDTLPVKHVVTGDTMHQEGNVDSSLLAEKLKPVKDNFKRINAIAKWTSSKHYELAESTEGGEAVFYYSNGILEKIVTRNFGETFQQLTEFYLLNGQLSFVFEKSVQYNRPIYYDSAAMKENKDDQAFDIEKSEISEQRNYIDNGVLVHQVQSLHTVSHLTNEYLLKEQNRLKADFEKVKGMAKKN